MSVQSPRRFVSCNLLSIVLGVVIVEATFIGLDTIFPYAKTTSGWSSSSGSFYSPFGVLTLTALAVSDREVVLNLMFVNQLPDPHYKLEIWIGNYWNVSLPEGLELLNGTLFWNDSANIERVSIEARVRAIKDGEWIVAGFAKRYVGGSFESLGTGALLITVSDGKVTDIRKWESKSPPTSSRIKLGMGGFSHLYALSLRIDLTLENMTIRVTNGVAANYPPNQTIFFDDTMCGLRIDKIDANGNWQTYMIFGEPGTSKLEPWESEDVTVSLDVFKEKGIYRAISEGWFEQNSQKVTVWADVLFEVLSPP